MFLCGETGHSVSQIIFRRRYLRPFNSYSEDFFKTQDEDKVANVCFKIFGLSEVHLEKIYLCLFKQLELYAYTIIGISAVRKPHAYFVTPRCLQQIQKRASENALLKS